MRHEKCNNDIVIIVFKHKNVKHNIGDAMNTEAQIGMVLHMIRKNSGVKNGSIASVYVYFNGYEFYFFID